MLYEATIGTSSATQLPLFSSIPTKVPTRPQEEKLQIKQAGKEVEREGEAVGRRGGEESIAALASVVYLGVNGISQGQGCHADTWQPRNRRATLPCQRPRQQQSPRLVQFTRFGTHGDSVDCGLRIF